MFSGDNRGFCPSVCTFVLCERATGRFSISTHFDTEIAVSSPAIIGDSVHLFSSSFYENGFFLKQHLLLRVSCYSEIMVKEL